MAGIPSLRRKVHAIVPPVEMRSGACRSRPPFRFVFIGSDRQTQNKLSLDVLTTLWAELRPATALHVYGSQARKPPDVLNMHWHGFVADLNDVYAPGSILLVPAVLPGGIKTKVLEAFSFGAPCSATRLPSKAWIFKITRSVFPNRIDAIPHGSRSPYGNH